ncbi:MAG TPA: hypothetical protein VK150_05750 [Geothrix sp.]|nr:hypothetical protein [Geothrix sp.]
MVQRTIQIIGQDGETVLGELTIQDGGAAADLNIPRDWFTPESLDDVATACTRMAQVIRQYQAEGGA